MTSKLLIITVVHNRPDITEEFCRQVSASNLKVEVLLVDDGSTDDTVQRVLRILGPSCHVLTGDGKQFWGGGLAMAHEWLKCNPAMVFDYIGIMNDDTFFGPDFFGGIVAELKCVEPKTVVCAHLINRTNGIEYVGFAISWFPYRMKETQDFTKAMAVPTRAIFFRYDDCIRCDGVNGARYPHYLSDIDYTYRLWKKGYKFTSGPGLTIGFPDSLVQRSEKSRRVRPGWREFLSIKNPRNPYYHLRFVIDHAPLGTRCFNILLIISKAMCRFFLRRI